MTPEELEDLTDMQESVDQIALLVRTADADLSLSPDQAAQIADIARQTAALVQDLLTEAEDEAESEARVEMLRKLLDKAAAADQIAGAVLARQTAGD